MERKCAKAKRAKMASQESRYIVWYSNNKSTISFIHG